MAVIGINLAGASSLRYVNINANNQSRLLTQLSSGKRVNQAKDDAAALSLSARVISDGIALGQAALNAQTGIAVLNTAEGGLRQINDILTRLKAIATAGQAGTPDTNAFTNLNKEYTQLVAEITSVAAQTRFNNVALLNGTGAANTFSNASGANILLGTVAADAVTIITSTATAEFTSGAAGLALATTSVSNAANSALAAIAIDTAIVTVTGARATGGANISRAEFRLGLINVQKENTDAANSALLDADVALAQTQFTTADVLAQSSIAALQKANALPQQLLRLLQS